jgi:hypothetical protein
MRPVRSAPVKVTAAIARQLQLLCDDPDDTGRFATGLTQLGASMAAAVPSCVSISVWLAVVGRDAPLTIGIHDGRVGPVLASLAVPWSLSAPCDIVLFQASEAGAFLLLADDLRVLLDPLLPLLVDEHLHIQPEAPAGRLLSSIADLSVVNRAVGILIDRGLPPEEARAELSRRAQQNRTDIADASRVLLDSMETPPTAVHN